MPSIKVNDETTSPTIDASASALRRKELQNDKTGSSLQSKSMSTSIGYVDPNTDPSMLTQEMKARLFKQNEGPRTTAESLVREYAFVSGAGESTLPLMPMAG